MKNQIIEKFGMLVVATFIISIITPCQANAAQFAIVGPRALGMGGASVAAVNDSTAIYWNPAALAQFRKLDIRIPAGVAIHDHMGLKDKWDRIDEINALVNAGDITAATELRQLLLDLDRPKTGTDVDTSAGLLASIPLLKSAIGVSVMGFGYAGLFPIIDTVRMDTNPALPTYVGNNSSQIVGFSLVTVEPAVSFATSLGDKFFIGANAKMIMGATYMHADDLRTVDFDDFLDDIDNSKTESDKASLDAGILFSPIKMLSIGVVGRNLTSPKFKVFGGTAEFELEPQYRAGVAFKPIKMLTLTADYDLSKNKTFTPEFEDQTLAVGAELTLPAEIISFRGGGYKNLANGDSNFVYTAGLGFRIFAFRLDFAGAYDFDEREYQASVDIALRF